MVLSPDPPTARTNPVLAESRKARFERFVERYSADMYRYALALSRHQPMAEDLVQETFLRAWRRLETLREESKAKSWLLTTLRREYFRQFERIGPVFEDVELDTLPGTDDTPSDDVDAVRQAIMALPTIHRDVLALQVVGGFTGREIGEILGLARATVNTRLFRARQSLKHQLASNHPGFTPHKTVGRT